MPNSNIQININGSHLHNTTGIFLKSVFYYDMFARRFLFIYYDNTEVRGVKFHRIHMHTYVREPKLKILVISARVPLVKNNFAERVNKMRAVRRCLWKKISGNFLWKI